MSLWLSILTLTLMAALVCFFPLLKKMCKTVGATRYFKQSLLF